MLKTLYRRCGCALFSFIPDHRVGTNYDVKVKKTGRQTGLNLKCGTYGRGLVPKSMGVDCQYVHDKGAFRTVSKEKWKDGTTFVAGGSGATNGRGLFSNFPYYEQGPPKIGKREQPPNVKYVQPKKKDDPISGIQNSYLRAQYENAELAAKQERRDTKKKQEQLHGKAVTLGGGCHPKLFESRTLATAPKASVVGKTKSKRERTGPRTIPFRTTTIHSSFLGEFLLFCHPVECLTGMLSARYVSSGSDPWEEREKKRKGIKRKLESDKVWYAWAGPKSRCIDPPKIRK